ncbi:VOC family protein [Methylosarcina fibrata]|uniref:VOC family protein n=1 Tax=Methylosarcina fibrata TaxID=105972 RepID=UPI0003620958|nr:VOC family protein [Methylosarcina fibrata]
MNSNPSNPVVWFEIYVENMARAKTFYEATLDVKLEIMQPPTDEMCKEANMEMWRFPKPKDNETAMTTPGANGMLVKMEGYKPGVGGTLAYFGCEDCGVTAARAANNGGRICNEKMSIGEYGFIALVHDTEGNMIGLHSMQ